MRKALKQQNISKIWLERIDRNNYAEHQIMMGLTTFDFVHVGAKHSSQVHTVVLSGHCSYQGKQNQYTTQTHQSSRVQDAFSKIVGISLSFHMPFAWAKGPSAFVRLGHGQTDCPQTGQTDRIHH